MFSGSYVAIVTPFKNGRFDRDAYAELIEFQIENGTSGIIPVGTTGESATLNPAEHEEVIRACVEIVRKRISVIAGTGSNSTAEALELTLHAKELGADAALLISPYYNKPTQDGIYLHYKAIAEAVDLPLILYDCPGRTSSTIKPETVARLSKIPNIAALKDAVGNVEHTCAVRALCDITILSGSDQLNLPILSVGGKGAISVLANVVPRAVAGMIAAFQAGDTKKAEQLHLKYFPLTQALFLESNPIPVKAALELMGRIGPEIRSPLVPMSEGPRKKLEAEMRAVGLLA